MRLPAYTRKFKIACTDNLIFILLGIIPTIFGHGILSYSLKFFPTTIVISVPLGEPIVASLLGWLVFKEIIPGMVMLCAILVLGGLYFIIQNSPE